MASSLPEAQAYFEPSRQTDPPGRYKGYDDLNKPLTNAAFVSIAEVERTRDLLTHRILDRPVIQEVKEPRFIEASFDYLDSQEVVEMDESKIRLLPKG